MIVFSGDRQESKKTDGFISLSLTVRLIFLLRFVSIAEKWLGRPQVVDFPDPRKSNDHGFFISP
jgi:hypothetical protein